MSRIFTATDRDGDQLDVSVHMDGYYITVGDAAPATVIIPGEKAVQLAHAKITDISVK